MPYYNKDPERDPNIDNHPCGSFGSGLWIEVAGLVQGINETNRARGPSPSFDQSPPSSLLPDAT